jgi:hypothetical protein
MIKFNRIPNHWQPICNHNRVMAMPKLNGNFFPHTLLTVLLVAVLTGCNLPTAPSPTTTSPEFTPVSELQQTILTFRLALPQSIPPGDSIYLTFLDEVTGLAFNPHTYIMQAEDTLHYSVSLPFYLGKMLKYRYSRVGAKSVDEHLYDDRPVRYRLYHVEGPGTIDDVLSGWTDTPYTGPTGRIMGSVEDSTTHQPIPNILVAAGGEQALTLADGSFLLEGLPPGTHNLVFYSLDGSYNLYQQGAVIAADSTTPVSVGLSPARLVTVIFTVKLPTSTPTDAPVRLAGNLSQLGNTFADLAGGMSSLPTRMPTLGRLTDGRFMVTLSLPAGAYIEYKYTLGDGLWSAELSSKSETRLRQLIVPSTNLEVNDIVDAWGPAHTQPIRFEVTVPSDTPATDPIYIQFNPGFGWLQPLPMWPTTNSQGQPVWCFDLTGPFNQQASLHYRYCRGPECGAADDSATMGASPTGREIDPSTNHGTVQDQVLNWAWYSGAPPVPSVPSIQIIPRPAGFVAGVALQPTYRPSWAATLPAAFQDINALGANWVLLSPTWTFTNHTPPILEPEPQQDMLWPDLLSAIGAAQHTNMNVGLFPSVHFPSSAGEWWQSADRDYPWWMSFFERYTNFILQQATAASQTNAGLLVLGGDWLSPALPGGVLSDGTPSNVPQNAEQLWRDLLAKVRERYSGTIAWALPYPDGMKSPPPFLDAVDQVYVLWSAPLSTQPGAPLEEMQAQAARLLDQDLLPFQQQVGKPLILAISYPSIDRTATGCISIQGGGCLDYSLLAPPNTDIQALNLDLQAQADAYNAVLTAINDRPWISGYVSLGYYPPTVLQDKSTSIHGKPVAGVFWYWSTKFLGQ